MAGIATALTGIALESQVLVWVAIGLLAISAILRVVIRIRERRAESLPPGE